MKCEKCELTCHHLNNVNPVFCRPISDQFHGAKIFSVLSEYVGIKVNNRDTDSDVHAKAG